MAPATAITDAVLDQAIADAGAFIDGYVAVVYKLPLASIPPALIKIACEIALANLYRDAMPEHVAGLKTSGVSWLRDVRDGKVRLFPDDAPTDGAGAGLVETTGPARMFDARTLRDVL